MTNKLQAIEILCDSSSGRYIPQRWYNECREIWECDVPNIGILDDPDNEYYWEIWTEVLDYATFENNQGTWRLHQDGDLFAVNDKLMTDDQYSEFYGEERTP